ncbi:MAG TPA: lipoyl(octanoyl) transferase LipB [Ramlibacter sp.]|nr:lipoyl(octanoyl) transferase LipB [Ramlibacter sp.]
MKAIVRGQVDYMPTYEAMKAFTAARGEGTQDELWLCEHPPVYTQGLAGKPEHVIDAGDIEVVATNRGGQVTYHGPGQVVAYPLMDLKRAGYFVKEYVYRIEEAVIRTLAHFGVTGHRVRGAPGIYVRVEDPFSHARLDTDQFDGLAKIAALGIKISRNCTYHGVAFNVDMDLEPFTRIDPCGYAGLKTVDLSTIGVSTTWGEAADLLARKLEAHLSP